MGGVERISQESQQLEQKDVYKNQLQENKKWLLFKSTEYLEIWWWQSLSRWSTTTWRRMRQLVRRRTLSPPPWLPPQRRCPQPIPVSCRPPVCTLYDFCRIEARRVTITKAKFAKATSETILVTEVEARVIEGRLIVRESGRKTSTTRVEEAFLSLDKLEIAAEGVTARGRHCQVSTIVDQVIVKKLKISAQSIVIHPL